MSAVRPNDSLDARHRRAARVRKVAQCRTLFRCRVFPRIRSIRLAAALTRALTDAASNLAANAQRRAETLFCRLKSELIQDGGRLPAASHDASVNKLVGAYAEFADSYYRKDGKVTDEVRMSRASIKIMRELYGRTSAADFGLLALKAHRNQMLAKDWCRSDVNKQVDRVKRMFKWGTENEMIPSSMYDVLRCVAGLKRGGRDARERRKVAPVCDSDTVATIAYLPATATDMVQLQR